MTTKVITPSKRRSSRSQQTASVRGNGKEFSADTHSEESRHVPSSGRRSSRSSEVVALKEGNRRRVNKHKKVTLSPEEHAEAVKCYNTEAPAKTLMDRGGWVMHAACRDVDPEELFVRGAEQRRAALICVGCPVIGHCLADALDNRIEFGVWGGLTERQRRALLRKNPHIDSWADFLAEGGILPVV